MRLSRLGLTAIAMTTVIGFAAPTDTLPPHTVALSQMMRELSTQPGFTEAFLAQIDGGRKRGGALLTTDLLSHLRALIVGKDWVGLDRFPGWTMSEITPTVGAMSRIVGDDKQTNLTKYLDVGTYSLDFGDRPIDFREPAPPAPLDPVESLGNGVTRGDGPSSLASEHDASQRLAYALNRLAANGLDGVRTTSAIWDGQRQASTPEALIRAIAETGQTVIVTDSRYFANFGHLHWNGQDVMMPFYINTQILVPGTSRPLLVPVSHAEYEWHIRGPLMNADVSLYFGIDGKAEFRTMDELDQTWVMKRDAHTYTGTDVAEVTRLSGLLVQAYVRLHQAHPAVPFGGYYAFGVCQDVVASIELKMTGRATLFPNTADDRLFVNPRDAEINDMIRRLPKDRDGAPPAVERVFASLPMGSSEDELAKVTIPGLGADLAATHRAWTEGRLKRTESPLHQRLRLLGLSLAAAVALALAWRTMRRRRRADNG